LTTVSQSRSERGAGNTGAGGEGVKDKIVYKRINITNADGEEVSPSDYLDKELGSSLNSYTDDEAQVEEQFNALLDMDEIMPRGLEGGGSLKIVDGNGVFTIGDKSLYGMIFMEKGIAYKIL
jgi:hypothetical protein